MSSNLCTSRLRKELKELQKNPVENIRAVPKENNILEWHYVLQGAKNTDYAGGYYHGIISFAPAYPYKPPSIQMLTPNGRFKTSTRLCLSMSDFHPETWNPMWSVGTILMGLYSFMGEEAPTHGSITSTPAFRRKAARESLELNCQNRVFCELFPDLVELNEKNKAAKLKTHQEEGGSGSESSVSSTNIDAAGTFTAAATAGGAQSWIALVALLVALLAVSGTLLALLSV